MLNFKDWKLASSDNEKATLRHAKGHEMTIAVKALPKIQREQIKRLAKVQNFDEGSPNTVQSDDNGDADAPVQQAPAGTHITINAAPAAPVQQPAVAQPAQNAAGYNAVAAQPPPQSAIPNGPSSGVLNPNGQLNPSAAPQAAQAAVEAQKQVDIAKAKANVPNEQGIIQGTAQTQANIENVYKQLQDETNKLYGDINSGKINPNHFMEQMSAPKKTLSGLGLVLGGMGAGMLGSAENPAMRFINSQIDRDIDAQKASFGNKKTILGAYENLFGQGVTATNLARNAMLEVYKHNIDLIANQLGTPQAQANALKAKADIGNQQQQNLKASALDITALPGYHATYSDTTAANIPKATPSVIEPEGGMTTAELQQLHEQQTKEPQKASIAGGHGSNKELEGITKNSIKPILTPNAERAYLKSQYNPQAEPHRADIEAQYKRAKLADEQLRTLNETYGQLIKESNPGGFLSGAWGRLHRDFDPEAVPTGGSDIATGIIKGLARLGSAATNTDRNRVYDANKTKLIGALTSALQGQVGDGTIHELVDRNAPEYGDSPESLRNKLKNVEKFIRDHVPTSDLEPFGIAHKSGSASGG